METYIYDYKFFFNIGSYIYVSVHLGFPLKLKLKHYTAYLGFLWGATLAKLIPQHLAYFHDRG